MYSYLYLYLYIHTYIVWMDGLAEATKQARIALRLADAIEVYFYL